jgi:hypothetical protein
VGSVKSAGIDRLKPTILVLAVFGLLAGLALFSSGLVDLARGA